MLSQWALLCARKIGNMHKEIKDAMQVAGFYSSISFLR